MGFGAPLHMGGEPDLGCRGHRRAAAEVAAASLAWWKQLMLCAIC